MMFVGEAPGEVEERIGKAFIGKSGKMLDQWIAQLGLSEEDVFITNVVKCRPPKNRDPTPDEIEACLPQLAREIRELKPALVVPLGRFAKEVVSHMRETGDLSEEQYGCGIKHPAWYLRKGGWPTAELQFLMRRLKEKERNDDEKDLTPSISVKSTAKVQRR